jgi:hypothetical protein
MVAGPNMPGLPPRISPPQQTLIKISLGDSHIG